MTWKCIFVGLQIEYKSRGVLVRRGAPLFPARRAHLLTTRKRAVVWPSATVRSPRGDCAFYGKRPPMPPGIDGATGKVTPVPSPVACENLPPAAFHSLRGTEDEGRETKDGGKGNWQFAIIKEKFFVHRVTLPKGFENQRVTPHRAIK